MMKKLCHLILLLLLLSCDSDTARESSAGSLETLKKVSENLHQEKVSPIEGYYIGAEEDCNINEEGEKHCIETADGKWYKLTQFTVKGDSVFVSTSPIRIKEQDTTYAEAGGVFYMYAGPLIELDSAYTAKTVVTDCLYCLTEKKLNPQTGKEESVIVSKDWHIKRKGNDLLINDVFYRKSIDKWLRQKVTIEEPLKSMIINSKYPPEHLWGVWGEDNTYRAKFGFEQRGFTLTEKVFYYNGQKPSSGVPYVIDHDTISIFLEDAPFRSLIKKATGNHLVIHWSMMGREMKYDRIK